MTAAALVAAAAVAGIDDSEGERDNEVAVVVVT